MSLYALGALYRVYLLSFSYGTWSMILSPHKTWFSMWFLYLVLMDSGQKYNRSHTEDNVDRSLDGRSRVKSSSLLRRRGL